MHVDLYRLTNDCAIDQLDILSQVTSNTIAFIEWIDQTSIIQSNVMITLTIGKESETHDALNYHLESLGSMKSNNTNANQFWAKDFVVKLPTDCNDTLTDGYLP